MPARTLLWIGTFTCALATAAHAAFTISNARTRNVTCSSGVCTPTGGNANLNTGDLQTMLASADVIVKSNASAPTLGVLDPLTWASSHRLVLDAYQSLHVRAPIVVEGKAVIVLGTNDGGTNGDYIFETDTSGAITFWDTASTLIINDQRYTLEKDIKSLASDAAEHPTGNYALAAAYDASADGTYTSAPIPGFDGAFEGLGNAIQNLTINSKNNSFGFFGRLAGSVRDLVLENEHLDGNGTAGGLAAVSIGTVSNVEVTGSVRGGCAGGVIGINEGSILNSGSSVSTRGHSAVGGLVCINEGYIAGSFATGQVVGGSQAGGLIGSNKSGSVYQSFSSGSVQGTSDVGGLIGAAPHARTNSVVTDCYSTGTITGSKEAAGGLIGLVHANRLTLRSSFATGMISAQENSTVGGVIGTDFGLSNDALYWDLDTTGISNPHQGAGQPLDDPGITGLTNAQLRSALPSGFDPTVWGQNVNINKGWPYLLANPPQ